ncbi:hypothetical protein GlitD10_2828 [Gloeomargarita lithophora Alchichica-D10]|uniref:Uncharacterized protein n=1 Tax=Gloeomargarita lithophora Alchichica-D10 TaxID=1188229 RepID=A0A1J0AGU9_9CYAN|nr:hypothetical protein [Gloeomargarita lithophora]APB35172.1 hypothetical protein GlitD10_2828 [Gloeomargarita lithophora Alchichica-D10]
MSDPSPNFWQKAQAKIQDMASSPPAQQVKKLAQNAAQQIGETAQGLQHQTEELLQSERVQHLRQDATQTAHKVTQQAGTVLGQVSETLKTTATDLVQQAKKQLDTPPKTIPPHAPANENRTTD